MSDGVYPCPKCSTPRVTRISRTAKNPGREFITCPKNCEGSFKWVDTLPKYEFVRPLDVRTPSQRTKDFLAKVNAEHPPYVTPEEKAEAKPADPLFFLNLPETEVKPETSFVPSKYQEAIFDFIQNEDGNADVEAVAGSGKSTTLIKALEYTSPQLEVGFVAFNKHIVAELEERAPSHVHVSTLHSLGLQNVISAFSNKPEVNEYKLWDLWEKIDPYSNFEQLKPTVTKLVNLAKSTMVEPSPQNIDSMVDHFDIEVNGDIEQVYELTPKLYDLSLSDTSMVDFTDMVYLGAIGRIPTKKFDVLLVDECLPYDIPVLMADGTSMKIGDIVESKFSGEVLSYNANTGAQEKSRIVNWHKILNQKPLVKISAKWSKMKGTNSVTSFVVCTTDHRVWTKRGWIEAGKIGIGDTLQVETSAQKTQRYKITTSGRETLAREIKRKNKQGITGRHARNGGISVRGGNGRGLTVPQETLLNTLGEGWFAEYAIPTSLKQGSGYPTCYKVDIGNPELRIAVEVDGQTHRSAKFIERDLKKESLLRKLGWTVIRFSNRRAVQDTSECVSEIFSVIDCPIDATVVSVEPISIPDYYVYDISVEPNHNFYANSILVHNCQDMSDMNLKMIKNSVRDNGRIIVVGDSNQAIYGWSGAGIDSMERARTYFKGKSFPLSICYRCDRSIVALAKQIVPQIEARDGAGDGIVDEVRDLAKAKTGDMILCRVNAPLVEPCFNLIRQGVKATIRGRDIGNGLIAMLKRGEQKARSNQTNEALRALSIYIQNERAKLIQQRKEARAASLNDQLETLYALSEDCLSTGQIRNKIRDVFSDDKSAVTFSSVHKAKGLQSDRVFILKPELMPFPKATQDWQIKQEWNCKYIALTRAKHELYFVVK